MHDNDGIVWLAGFCGTHQDQDCMQILQIMAEYRIYLPYYTVPNKIKD